MLIYGILENKECIRWWNHASANFAANVDTQTELRDYINEYQILTILPDITCLGQI